MSGPDSWPVKARRRGKNRALPLRPVVSDNPLVHVPHVLASHGWGGMASAAIFRNALSSSATKGVTAPRAMDHQPTASDKNTRLGRTASQKASSTSGPTKAIRRSFTASKGVLCKMRALR